ncbi:carbohydrate esterase family 10 protein [Ceratobasidium sp. AG-Ba]|nr:carbohydrate esterase family 10 protein [Ceratobasidium sp. AG-Ba]
MSLTTTMGVKLGPIVLGTLFKHYLERHNVIRDSKARNELLFDEAFIVVKSFLEESTKHTVEELQQFSNTRIPSPPWVHNVKAVGGSKWWQVRGVRGVDAQWVAVKRDWREAERRRKQREGDPTLRRQNTETRHPSLFDQTNRQPARHNTIIEHSPQERPPAEGLRRVRTAAARSRPASAYGVVGEREKEVKRPSTAGGASTNGLGAGMGTPSPMTATPESSTSHIPKVEPVQEAKETEEEEEEGDAHYEPEMDDMRCMLYIHGGGYYFGSIDQQRYCMQRYARKMGGRVFAVNYRLAPQYPFPCALQDCLAAYLYLIRPPPGAKHLPVPPSMVIIAGDSAGGGMTLALLQIIRDVGLPAPAGGVLISPWCDLTHSFPSVLTNTATDIIPPYGLSLYKPSTLWPPPSEEFTADIHRRMTTRVQDVVRRGKSKLGLGPSGASELDLSKLGVNEQADKKKRKLWKRRPSVASGAENAKTARGDSLGLKLVPSKVTEPETSGSNGIPEDHPAASSSRGPSSRGPSPSPDSQTHPGLPRTNSSTFSKKSGKRQSTVDPSKGEIALEIDGQVKVVKSQIQLYAQNHQLTHPLVSPALGYLGGLPPLFILASDKEVLRDEIIYVAHKAAHPDRYPVKPEAKERLASLRDIEQKGYPPTMVHLQVYDETCHVLPLFSFTTPAKYCYRAIALFCKHVTQRTTSLPPTPVVLDASVARSPEAEPALLAADFSSAPGSRTPSTPGTPPIEPSTPSRRPSITSPRSLTFTPSLLRRRTTTRRGGQDPTSPTSPTSPARDQSDDIAGPRFQLEKNEPPTGVGTAGDPSVYNLQAIGQPGFESPFTDNMIRERVSTSGVLRPLEPESELAACTMDLADIGAINAAAVKRYLEGQALWDEKFKSTIKSIAKERAKHLELARKEGRKSIAALHGALANGSPSRKSEDDTGSASSSMTFLGSSTWNMSWALDGENPPPSSIVSRRDTAEARQLAVCADRDLGEESKMSGNNLWSVVVDFLTQTPDRNGKSTDPLVQDSVTPTDTSNNLDINVQPPTPSSPVPPSTPAGLPRKRSSTFFDKFIKRDSPSEGPKATPRRPMTLFIDSNRNSGLPVVDK